MNLVDLLCQMDLSLKLAGCITMNPAAFSQCNKTQLRELSQTTTRLLREPDVALKARKSNPLQM